MLTCMYVCVCFWLCVIRPIGFFLIVVFIYSANGAARVVNKLTYLLTYLLTMTRDYELRLLPITNSRHVATRI